MATRLLPINQNPTREQVTTMAEELYKWIVFGDANTATPVKAAASE